MSARPWRVESRVEGASAWHEDRNFGAFATAESAAKTAEAWKRYSKNDREYRVISRDAAEAAQ